MKKGNGFICRSCRQSWPGISALISGRGRRAASSALETRLWALAQLAAPLRDLARDELRALIADEALEAVSVARVARVLRLDVDAAFRLYRQGDLAVPWLTGRYEDQVLGFLRAEFPRTRWSRGKLRKELRSARAQVGGWLLAAHDRALTVRARGLMT